MVARLIYDQKVTIKYAGSTIQPDNPKLPDMLRKKSEIGKTSISKRQMITATKMRAVKEMLREEAYCNLVWNEHTESKTLMFSILKDGKYVGYCGIKNISHKPWEIVIEIQKEWTRQGIGPIAISAMLNEIKSRSGVTQYRVRIDPANQASQKMFEKLGAVPNGISELWIHDEEALAQCEKDNLHQIDGQITELAKKFGVAPQKLLSHVLEYTLSWT